MWIIIIIIFIMILWATMGDILEQLEKNSEGTYKENTVNNYYNECGVNNDYEGNYEVNKWE